MATRKSVEQKGDATPKTRVASPFCSTLLRFLREAMAHIRERDSGIRAGRGQEPAIGGEADGPDRAVVTVRPKAFTAGCDLPEADRPAIAGGGQQAAIGGEGNGGSPIFMAAQLADEFP